MKDAADPSSWLTVSDAFPLLRNHFRTKSALHYHLRHRDRNGLAAADAVRVSPVGGYYLIHVPRLIRWAVGEVPTRSTA